MVHIKYNIYVIIYKSCIYGHVHKYEAGLWTLRKSEKVTFCYKIINFSF